ncbi:MAG TPA: response regulator [Saprospiraceae bacterium]|nr:response regulator [Saprospiraceae bacterium]HMP24482.1 response regulator [Saprospiraceae bacterium]
MEHILLVENNLPDIELIRSYLDEAWSSPYRFYNTKSLQDALDTIRYNPIDVVLLDLGLDDITGIPTLKALLNDVPSVPVVVLTGSSAESLGINAIKFGAQDFLLKGEFSPRQLARTVRHAMFRYKKQADLYLDMWEMQQWKKQTERLLHDSGLGSWEINVLDNAMTWSDEMFRILGHQPGSFSPKQSDYLRQVYAADREAVEQFFTEAMKTGKAARIEHRAVVNTRNIRHLLLRAEIHSEESTGRILLLGSIQDVTELYRSIQSDSEQLRTVAALPSVVSNIHREMSDPLFQLATLVQQQELPHPAEQRQNIEKYRSNLAFIMDKMLHEYNLVMLTGAEHTMQQEVVEVQTLTQRLYHWVALQAARLGVSWVWPAELGASGSYTVLADVPLLSFIGFNFLNTALHHTDQNSPLSIRTTAVAQPQTDSVLWQLTIESPENTIASRQRQKLIKLITTVRQRKTCGLHEDPLTLGLFNMLKMIDSTGGLLKTDKEQSITLTLPLERAPMAPDMPKTKPNIPRGLIIEHESIVRMLLQRQIQMQFAHVELDYVEDLKEGARKISENTYTFVLLDAQTPAHNGMNVQALMQYRSDHTAIIVILTDTSPETTGKWLSKGARACISYPPQKQDVTKAVGDILSCI